MQELTEFEKFDIKLNAWLFYACCVDMPKQPNPLNIERDVILYFNKWIRSIRLSESSRSFFRLAVFGKIPNLQAGFLLQPPPKQYLEIDEQIYFINSCGNDKIN